MSEKLTKPRGLTDDELKAQGARCGCRGNDDYCVCQNVPDAITVKDWGLTPRGSIPTTYYNLLDLLQKLAAPTSDPNLDVMGETMMDYWRRDAQRLLPAFIAGEIAVDEAFGKLLHDASWEAQTLRDLRTEVRGRSANLPTLEPIQWAQDAAKTIDGLIAAFQSRAALKLAEPSDV